MDTVSSMDRITLALSTLKSELMDMRSQDVKLMKQLMSINTTISSMTSKQPNPRYRSASFGGTKQRPGKMDITYRRSSDIVSNLKNPLMRYRSEPVVTDDSFECEEAERSLKDINAMSEGFDSDMDSMSDSNTSLSSSCPSRRNSYLRVLPEEENLDDKKYHGILMKNIKLWKYSQESISSTGSDISADD